METEEDALWFGVGSMRIVDSCFMPNLCMVLYVFVHGYRI
jgi:hypothetical protein